LAAAHVKEVPLEHEPAPLETSAKAKLVTRTAKGVELTTVGAALLSHVSKLQVARDDLAREVADLVQGRAGSLRIGASPSNSEIFVHEACSTLLMEAPKVTLSVSVMDNAVAGCQALRRDHQRDREETLIDASAPDRPSVLLWTHPRRGFFCS
jgi:DNA-binding transcriptional LysR family regulator